MALLRPVLSLPTVLALALMTAPTLELGASHIDRAATTRGLQARVGALEGWTIVVRDTAAANVVKVALRSPDGRQQQRRVALTGTTDEDRSRELAASLALVVEQWDDPQPSKPPPSRPARTTPAVKPTPAPAPAVRGWLGLGPRLGIGRTLAEGGLDLQGGAWLLRQHLQPLASLGWSATGRDGLGLHTLRFGLGLAVGAPLLGGRLWLGGHALAHAAWTRVHDSRSAHVWSSSDDLGALVQYRSGRFVAGVRTGVELSLPQLRARGNLARLDRGPLLWFLGLSFGVVFG